MVWNPRFKSIQVKVQEAVSWPNRGFSPPVLAASLSVGRNALALSIGRNLSLASANSTVVHVLAQNAQRTLGILIDQSSSDLRADAETANLADQALVGFAHDLAVGVAGLGMEDAGFIWRDHAKSLLPDHKRRPDYVWSAGTAGVVLSEVKGMASSKKGFGALQRKTWAAFVEQIDDWKLDSLHTGEAIVGGYAIGVHLPALRQGGIAVKRSMPVLTSPSAMATPFPTMPIALGHYRAALTWIGADWPAAMMLERDRQISVALDREPLEFAIFSIGGQLFATTPRAMRLRAWPPLVGGIPALEINALEFALQLLDQSSDLRRQGGSDSVVRPPSFEPVETFVAGRSSPSFLTMAADGLALIRRPGRRKTTLQWTPWDGLHEVS